MTAAISPPHADSAPPPAAAVSDRDNNSRANDVDKYGDDDGINCNDGSGKMPGKIAAALAMPRFYDHEDGGQSLVFVDAAHSSSAVTTSQGTSPSAHNNQAINADTINSNASGASMAERTSVRNLFMQSVKRQNSSSSVVRLPESPSHRGEGDGEEDEDEEEDENDDDDDDNGDDDDDDEDAGDEDGDGEGRIGDDDFSSPHLMPYQQRKRLSVREAGGGGPPSAAAAPADDERGGWKHREEASKASRPTAAATSTSSSFSSAAIPATTDAAITTVAGTMPASNIGV